jgi:hypothetical protein
LDNTRTVSSISSNPKYENIKNEFIIWGQRTSTSGANIPILYHLVIDKKPEINLANTYFYGHKIVGALPEEDIRWDEYRQEEPTQLIDEWELIGVPCGDWREELYRQALLNNLDGKVGSYDAELISFWRELYYLNDNKTEMVWNPNVETNPALLNYWLDFLDSS